MNGATLAALRRLLFFSVPEAARWVPVASDRPQGVEDRTWNRWEAGKVPVPANIAERMRELVNWADAAEQKALARLGKLPSDQPFAPRLVWYAEADDFYEHPLYWRPHCAVMARLAAKYPSIELVQFDAQAYQQWRQAKTLPDDGTTRWVWASEQRTEHHEHTPDTR